MPQGHYHIDGVLEGSHPPHATTRPTSLYSVRSMATSLPPYEAHQPMNGSLPYTNRDGQLTAIQTASAVNYHHFESSHAEDPSQPTTPSDPENALSMHYGRIVRTIDENHARQLTRMNAAHEQELAATRDAIDQVYRKEWKAKNREIERIREEAANEVEQARREAAADVAAIQQELETQSIKHDGIVARIQQENAEKLMSLHEEHQAAIEKARHAIEDLWEGRWNDRTRIAAEEARRVATEAERRDVERDEEWLKVIQSGHPNLVDGIKLAMTDFRARSKHTDDTNGYASGMPTFGPIDKGA